MYKSCSRCGRIHDSSYVCEVNKQAYDYSRYSTQEDRRLRNSNAWANKSHEIREKAQYLCEICRQNGVYNYSSLEVHHITKVRDNPALLLDDNNLICLCTKHHKQADKGLFDKEYLYLLVQKRERDKNKNALDNIPPTF